MYMCASVPMCLCAPLRLCPCLWYLLANRCIQHQPLKQRRTYRWVHSFYADQRPLLLGYERFQQIPPVVPLATVVEVQVHRAVQAVDRQVLCALGRVLYRPLQHVRLDSPHYRCDLAHTHPLVSELPLPGEVDVPLHEAEAEGLLGRSPATRILHYRSPYGGELLEKCELCRGYECLHYEHLTSHVAVRGVWTAQHVRQCSLLQGRECVVDQVVGVLVDRQYGVFVPEVAP
mmetsp:Transcript_20921/g.47333  ORF Transcript_20921/g.47333 Transcript_20921/m.47333 type:complete len:231 (-) Transcript_20921:846-1538(-)